MFEIPRFRVFGNTADRDGFDSDIVFGFTAVCDCRGLSSLLADQLG